MSLLKNINLIKHNCVEFKDTFDCIENMIALNMILDIYPNMDYITRFSEGVVCKRGMKRLSNFLQDIITNGIKNTEYNLFLSNIPLYSHLSEGGDVIEKVDETHIYDTLTGFGSVSKVLRVSSSSYFAKVDEPDEIAHLLNGMMIEKNKIRVVQVNSEYEYNYESDSISSLWWKLLIVSICVLYQYFS